jgi:hypothetical protein
MLHLIAEALKLYIGGQITVRSLETWLVSHLQAILDSSDQSAIQLVNSVDADLVELREGILNEITLEARISQYLQSLETVSVSLVEPRAYDIIESVSRTVRRWVEVPSAVTDYRFADQIG